MGIAVPLSRTLQTVWCFSALRRGCLLGTLSHAPRLSTLMSRATVVARGRRSPHTLTQRLTRTLLSQTTMTGAATQKTTGIIKWNWDLSFAPVTINGLRVVITATSWGCDPDYLAGSTSNIGQGGPQQVNIRDIQVYSATAQVVQTDPGFGVGTAPTITSANTATFTVGINGSFTVTTTGDPAPALTTSAMPTGLTFTDNGDGTATITGTAGAGTGGDYPLTITATNV